MRAECVDAVVAAAGRAGKNPPNATQLRGIEERILKAMRSLARTDRQAWVRLTPAQQLEQAGQAAYQEIVAEAAHKAANVAMQITATQRNQSFVDRMATRGMNRLEALQRMVVGFVDSAANFANIDQVRLGVRNFYAARMAPLIEGIKQFAGFWADRAAMRDILRELYGETTGNAKARDLAKQWSDSIAEPLRQQFNELGGAIGKLKDWAVPQEHSQDRVAHAGRDAWTTAILPMLDRAEYVNLDGSLMSDAQLTDVLHGAWETIATDGANKIEPGSQKQAGGVKRHGEQSRALHFKDADSYLEYQRQFGEHSLLETMVSHINRMSRDIATLKVLGPNAEAGFQFLREDALKKEVKANPAQTPRLNRESARAQDYFDYVAGKIGPAANPKLAKRVQALRNWVGLSSLGGAAISAIPDSATMHMVGYANGIPWMKRVIKELTSYVPGNEQKRVLMRAGVGIESMIDSLGRFGEDLMGHGVPSILANTLFRVSGLNALDRARRTATGAMLMDQMGQLTRDHGSVAALPDMYRVLKSKGIDDVTWQVWRAADLDGGLLTPDAIGKIPDAALSGMGRTPARLRRDAMQALVGVVNSETNLAVPAPTAKNVVDIRRAVGSPQRGTIGGEAILSMLQFKGFPLSILANNWRRLMSQPTVAGKVYYATAYIAGLTILGALSTQIKTLLKGQNPQDMTKPGFWGRAIVQGGGLGLYGDLFINPMATDYKQTIADFAGPLASRAERIYELMQAGFSRATDPEKRANVGGKTVGVVQSLIPFSNLWYTKAAIDHLLFQRLQEYFSPGYANRMRQRAQREFGSSYYWPPATGVDRIQAPDWANAVGD